ncbi:MAG: penicillin-binding protein 2 [Bacillota bacterium]|nr:penicillin-binding protein 2 [Bacillota bacterium]HPZ12992.1 penicillin-binding protein 2 [Bacillota bacterium]
MMNRTRTQSERRLRVFQIFALCLFLVLVGRLWQLQIIKGEYYKSRATANRLALVPISAPRGIITDRRGEVFATSRMAYTISVVPQEFSDREAEVRLLSKLLEMPVEEIEAKIAGQTEGRYGLPYMPTRLIEDVPPYMLVRVSEHKVELPGVIIEEEPYRSYPNGSLAGPIIGYVGLINQEELARLGEKGYQSRDRIGKSGVEREFEEYLRGQDGVTEIEVDSLSRPVATVGARAPVAGSTLVMTIDAKVQQSAEDALRSQLETLQSGKYKHATAGAAVALDPRTGEIIAMATEPGYDPGWFVPRISDEQWRQVSTGVSGLFNRAISGAYPPGSTFKPFTAIAALEAGVIDLDDRILCSPSVSSRYYRKRCSIWSRGRSHGYQNLTEGMINSCNIVFYELGARLSVDQMASAAKQFGLSQPTGLRFTPVEATGAVPDSSVRDFMPGELASYAIGQQVTVTPLQMAVAYGGIATRGVMYKPHLIRQVIAPDGTVQTQSVPEVMRTAVLSDRTWDYLHHSLSEVTRIGTASSAFRNFGIPVAGKTGTAEVPPGDPHAWFVGWAPADDPEIVVAVMIERGGGGGASAAPVARKIMEAYFAPTGE